MAKVDDERTARIFSVTLVTKEKQRPVGSAARPGLMDAMSEEAPRDESPTGRISIRRLPPRWLLAPDALATNWRGRERRRDAGCGVPVARNRSGPRSNDLEVIRCASSFRQDHPFYEL